MWRGCAYAASYHRAGISQGAEARLAIARQLPRKNIWRWCFSDAMVGAQEARVSNGAAVAYLSMRFYMSISTPFERWRRIWVRARVAATAQTVIASGAVHTTLRSRLAICVNSLGKTHGWSPSVQHKRLGPVSHGYWPLAAIHTGRLRRRFAERSSRWHVPRTLQPCELRSV